MNTNCGHSLFSIIPTHIYDGDHAPFTREGRQAFANWAAAAVKRYRGRGIVWEIYNEPNTGFWTPEPNVSDYVKLALETSKAIHQVAPAEQIIGPGVWGFDLPFRGRMFASGPAELLVSSFSSSLPQR